jgi:formylglycine-generating enzyme required for sulfatase activity
MNTATTSEQRAAAAVVEQNLFVTVPETTLPCVIVGGAITRPSITVPAFQVGQYLCSKGADGKAVVSATGAPWVEINYADARKACADAGFALITELQALSLAFNLFQQDMNWTGGEVGLGDMFQGLRLDLDDVDEPYAAGFVSRDPSERRGFFLGDGQLVMDAAGNAYTWVFDDVQGDENGLIAQAFAADSPSIATAPFASMERGMGWRPRADTDWSGYALVRGGCWFSVSVAGVFSLYRDWPDSDRGVVGFRCTKPIGL